MVKCKSYKFLENNAQKFKQKKIILDFNLFLHVTSFVLFLYVQYI